MKRVFLLILEPFETENATVPNPVFHLTCLDASLAIKPIFERFSSVIITSGTISPLEMYPKMLGFEATVQESYAMTLTRNCFLPLVITRGSDQVAISSRFEVRNDPSVVRNFGTILIEYCKIVPDGIVAFFPSYLYMESIVAAWHDMKRASPWRTIGGHVIMGRAQCFSPSREGKSLKGSISITITDAR